MIKNLSVKEGIEMVEDKWRLALDAAGDGMWDLRYMCSREKIFFSAKWHVYLRLYNPTEISTWDEWTDKIHPEDMPTYKKKVDVHCQP